MLSAARHAPGAREAVTGTLDVSSMLAWRDFMVSGYDDAGQVTWAQGAGIEVIRGRGRLAGPQTVKVGDRSWTARHVVVATGSVARAAGAGRGRRRGAAGRRCRRPPRSGAGGRPARGRRVRAGARRRLGGARRPCSATRRRLRWAPRTAGRIDTGISAYASKNDLEQALKRAAAAHGKHEERTGEADENWPSWYAQYMVAEQSGAELPT